VKTRLTGQDDIGYGSIIDHVVEELIDARGSAVSADVGARRGEPTGFVAGAAEGRVQRTGGRGVLTRVSRTSTQASDYFKEGTARTVIPKAQRG